jgi:hypothetical protein
LRHAGLDGLCVVHNGALIADVARAEPLLVRALAPATVRALLAVAARHGLSPLLFTAAPRGPGEVLVQEDASDPTGYLRWYLGYAKGHVARLPDLAAAPLDGVLRVVVHAERARLEPFLREGVAAGDAAGGALRGFIQRETTVPTCRGELLARAADKWSGVTWIAERLGIAPAEIVAVGDESNDVEMLRGAGHSFAAPGASADARRHARESLEGDGPEAVVRALERVFS